MLFCCRSASAKFDTAQLETGPDEFFLRFKGISVISPAHGATRNRCCARVFTCDPSPRSSWRWPLSAIRILRWCALNLRNSSQSFRGIHSLPRSWRSSMLLLTCLSLVHPRAGLALLAHGGLNKMTTMGERIRHITGITALIVASPPSLAGQTDRRRTLSGFHGARDCRAKRALRSYFLWNITHLGM
jgi:hypothetical protein